MHMDSYPQLLRSLLSARAVAPVAIVKLLFPNITVHHHSLQHPLPSGIRRAQTLLHYDRSLLPAAVYPVWNRLPPMSLVSLQRRGPSDLWRQYINFLFCSAVCKPKHFRLFFLKSFKRLLQCVFGIKTSKMHLLVPG